MTNQHNLVKSQMNINETEMKKKISEKYNVMLESKPIKQTDKNRKASDIP